MTVVSSSPLLLAARFPPLPWQVLLCFSRDTTVLDHFKYNSATPPRSYIQGERTHTHTRAHTTVHHYVNAQECHLTPFFICVS